MILFLWANNEYKTLTESQNSVLIELEKSGILYCQPHQTQKASLLRMPYVNLTKIYEKKCFTLTLQICNRI